MSLMSSEIFGEERATVVYGYLGWAFIPTQFWGPSYVAFLKEETGDFTIGFVSVGIITLIAAMPLIYVFVTVRE